MLRSAAKNHARVTVVCDPADYARSSTRSDQTGEVTPALRAELAAKAFAHTAAYDARHQRLPLVARRRRSRGRLPAYLTLPFERAYGLRYGENPHQAGAFYVERGARGGLARAGARASGGRQGASLQQPRRRRRGARRRAGVRRAGGRRREAHEPVRRRARRVARRRPTSPAREADPVSAFGGIVALNREVDAATAELLAETFLECVVAPSLRRGGARGAPREEEPAPAGDGRVAPARPRRPSSSSASAAGWSRRLATRRPRARWPGRRS